ncbi:putative adhesin [Sediminitomix flava]|uniref:Putative adhesin n=2 Tax=Sediminitomix flava TaxID=379075 RepID=A0A315ZJ45_SEDFL|nr:putative adhesin [Sediminitomix flava]
MVLGVYFPLHAEGEPDYQKERVINKSFGVGSSDWLVVENKFGNVHVESWDQNRLEVTIKITAWGRSEKEAAKILSEIDVEVNAVTGEYFFETITPDNTNINKKSGFKVNYDIKIPAENPINIENKYGTSYIDNRTGITDLYVAYGGLKARKLEGSKTTIKVSYSEAIIEKLTRGSLVARYCSNLFLGETENLELDNKYSDVEIETVGKLNGSSAYSGVKIEELKRSISLENRYGNFKIEEVSSSFEEIDVESKYGSVKIEFDSNTSFKFDISTRYGSFDHDLDEYRLIREIERNTSGEYVGIKGDSNSDKLVHIVSSYGSISLQ